MTFPLLKAYEKLIEEQAVVQPVMPVSFPIPFSSSSQYSSVSSHFILLAATFLDIKSCMNRRREVMESNWAHDLLRDAYV